MGSRRAAWRAGQTPKITPTARLNSTAATTVAGLKTKPQPASWPMPGRDDEAEDDADEPTEERQGQRLDEELGEDVAAARADGLADADLARPLADRDQHDVHDPDAADDQRDRGDPAEQQRQRRADRRRRFEQLGLVEDVEVGACRSAARSWRSRSSAVIAALAAVIWAGSLTDTPIVRTLSPPTKYFCTTPIGTMTWSSGSWKPVPPLAWRMPMTRNGSPPTEIWLPRSPAPRPSVLAVVAPRTATRRSCSRLTSVRNVPCQTS